MAYNSQIHHRRSIRLKGYDYSQAGLYFITICCQDRACRFGEIVGAGFTPAQIGQPLNTSGQPQGIAPTGATVFDIVGAYKSLAANGCLEIYKSKNEMMGKLWQRNYYEHIIRNEQSYQTISDYIINNPAKWAEDKFYRQ